MDKFAVIRILGKQYKVTEGEEILVDKLNDLKVVPEVLLYVDGDIVEVGTPVLKKAVVKIKVLKAIFYIIEFYNYLKYGKEKREYSLAIEIYFR